MFLSLRAELHRGPRLYQRRALTKLSYVGVKGWVLLPTELSRLIAHPSRKATEGTPSKDISPKHCFLLKFSLFILLALRSLGEGVWVRSESNRRDPYGHRFYRPFPPPTGLRTHFLYTLSQMSYFSILRPFNTFRVALS